MKKILVVGDMIIDEYVYLKTERMSSEAPLPVWDVTKREFRLGGAANVAATVKTLGDDVEVHVAGMVDDFMYYQMKSLDLNCSLLARLPDGTGVRKTRYVVEPVTTMRKSMLARIDNRKTFSDIECSLFENMMVDVDRDKYDSVIFSDYRMGTISERIAKKFCVNPSQTVVVDSKRNDLSMFRGAYVLKLNEEEHSKQASKRDYQVESLANFCIVTMGSLGAVVVNYEAMGAKQGKPTYALHSVRFPVEPVDVVDVTGCGDVFTAGLTYYMTTKSRDVYMSTKFANVCATKAVQKLGTFEGALDEAR